MAQTFVVGAARDFGAPRRAQGIPLCRTAGLCFGLAIIVNFVLAYAVWRGCFSGSLKDSFDASSVGYRLTVTFLRRNDRKLRPLNS